YAVTEDEAAQPGTGGTTSALGGWHIVLNPNTERKEEAMEVIRAMMTDEVNLGLFELWGWLPTKPELFESDQAAETGVVGNYLDTIRVAGENAMPRPSTTVWPTQATMIAEQANAAVAGDKSPEQAMNDLQSSLENTEQQ
ncbi:MAG TPA: sugar ABC transporter substrate-binding protein, partial [Natronoarchaeum rubrum]|nr:sugar ABC transporter substrate-binding protein [Natronoarchaeum rubrum]